jgi:acetolactate synthase-1/2/3 large subunit
MNKTNQQIDGGASIVNWLKAAGVAHVFSVSGGPINPIYRACGELGLPLVHTRHEAAACFMAEAASRLTGRAGAVVVTLGPGSTNTVTPALVSAMAGTPLIIIAAQAPVRAFERGAAMSWDALPILSSLAKWSARVIEVDRIPEYLDIAWRKMWAGRPGPVFLEVPADILSAQVSEGARATRDEVAPPRPVRPAPSAADAAALLAELGASKRPLLLLGDETFWDRADGWRQVIEKHHLPFATLRLARGIVDERHRLCIGPGYSPCNATLRRALLEADCIFIIGHHFEFDLEYGDRIGAQARVVQVASDTDLLHRNRRADLAVAASPGNVVSLLAEAAAASTEQGWVDELVSQWQEEWRAQLGDNDKDGALHPVAAIDAVIEAAPAETVYVSSHGNVDFWADARLRMRHPGHYLRAGQSGALGAEVPYGAGAAFADPGAPVIVFVGDGGIGYHVTELDTAERYGKPFVIVVLDDEMWGAIALPQQARFGATYEMDLPRRDWAKVAEALGCKGYVCREVDQIQAAVKDALASGKPALVQVTVRSVISPYMDYIS